jgi:hypothetical protein
VATLLEIKTAVATYFGKVVADLTVNNQDLFLVAVNQVRKLAELHHDFEFSRKLVTVTVNGTTGGSLLSAVAYGTATVVDIKSVIEIGLFDNDLNLRPVRWSTVSEGLRNTISRTPVPRYPSDAQAISPWLGQLSQLQLSGDTLYAFPKTTSGATENYNVGLEVYSFQSDWSATNASAVVTGGTGVTGVNTTYYPYSFYNGKPLYISLVDAGTPSALYFLWHDGTKWVLNQLVGTPGSNYHSLTSTSSSPVGSYTGHGTFTGTAVVAVTDATDIWTKHASQYLQWGTIVQLNHLYKEFVFRQEGNLPPPEKLRDEGLEAFKQWDAFRYEQFRSRE